MTSSPISAARSQYLLDLLAQIPDPRKRRGRRHPLAGLLAVGIAADQLPAWAGGKVGRTSRRRYLRRVRASVEQMETIGPTAAWVVWLRRRREHGSRWSRFLAPGSVLAALGTVGSGKTTMVRYTALEMTEQRL